MLKQNQLVSMCGQNANKRTSETIKNYEPYGSRNCGRPLKRLLDKLSSHTTLLKSVMILSYHILMFCILIRHTVQPIYHIFSFKCGTLHYLHNSPTCFGPFRPSSGAASLLPGLLQLPVHVYCVLTYILAVTVFHLSFIIKIEVIFLVSILRVA
jgi:hypothetical protein